MLMEPMLNTMQSVSVRQFRVELPLYLKDLEEECNGKVLMMVISLLLQLQMIRVTLWWLSNHKELELSEFNMKE